MERPHKRKLPQWIRWGIILCVLISIIVGAILWIINSQGSLATIISVLFVALSLIFSFFQVLPLLTEKSSHAINLSSSPSQPSQIVIHLPQTSSPLTSPAISPLTTEIVALSPAPLETHLHSSESTATIHMQEDLTEAPRIGQLYGREKELDTLKAWLGEDGCRLVVIGGIGGIGKTSLAAALTSQVKDIFPYVFWRSLQHAPPLKSILQDCVHFVSGQQQIDLPDDVESQISLLIRYLRKHRCLIILDNMETILQAGNRAGQYQIGFEDYGKLLQRIGEADHQSSILLTSRERPKDLVRLESHASSARSLFLTGIGQASAKELLAEKELLGTDETWGTFIHLYSGNPLALQLVSSSIQELFGGNITAFLQEKQAVFGDIHELLHQQFYRLSQQEQELLYWLAIEREAVSVQDLHDDLVHRISKRTLLEVLGSLRRRAMLEPYGNGTFSLQPVIMEYVSASFVEQVAKEIMSETPGIFNNHTLIKAQAKDYLRESQTRLILAPVAEQLCSTLGKEETEQRLRNILAHLRETTGQKQGYAAGNILNLLIQLQSDLRGTDFSHLPIRQAFLQGVALPSANFAYADLTSSVFTETFGNILAVAFSPDNRLLAAGTATGEIQFWQMPEGTPFLKLQGGRDWIRTVAFSPDGTILASGSDDHSIRLWDLETNQCIQILQEHSGRIYAIAFSLDGSILASGSDDQTICLWNVNTRQCLKRLQGHRDRVRCVTFSPDSTILASGSEDKTIRLWQVQTGECFKTFQENVDQVYALAFNIDGTILASGGDDQAVQLWQVNTDQCLKTLKGHSGRVYSLAFNFDSSLIASSGDDRSVRLWQVSTGQCLKVLQGHGSRVRSITFSPDGATLASGGDEQSVRLWQVSTGYCLKTLQGHSSLIHCVAFSPDGQTLANGCEDHSVRFWTLHTGQYFNTAQRHHSWIYWLTFSPDSTLIATASDDQTIRLWQVSSGQCLTVLQGHQGRVRSVAFSPDGKMLASGSDDQTIHLWQVQNGQCFSILQGHNGRVRSVAFSPTKDMLASGGDDRTIHLWHVATGQSLKTLQGHTGRVWSVNFDPTGTLLASSSDDHTIRLWDGNNGTCLAILQGHTGRIYSVAFAPHGNKLASGSEDESICLWDLNTGQCIKQLQGHSSRVRSVSFSPDGNTLVSGSHDGTVKLWNTLTGNCLQTLRNDRPYERMNIIGVKGITEAQKTMLKILGAIEA